MKIGLLVITGDIHRFGYQNTFQHVLKSHADFADSIILISSSRHNPKDLGKEYHHVLHLSDEQTWFQEINGKEQFSYDVLVKNNNRALALLKDQGCDVVAQVHINQYIDTSAAKNIRARAERMIQAKRPFAWLYKKYQLGEWMFNSDTRLPWILNLTIANPYRYVPDSIEHTQTGEVIRVQHGHFQDHNSEAVTDMLLHSTIEDARDLFLFTQVENLKLSGNQTAAKKPVQFDEITWKEYYLHKINQKIRSKERPGEPGKKLLEERQPDYLSYYFQSHYQPVGKVKQLIKRLASSIKQKS